MTPIKNMGPKSQMWLHEIGIDSLEDLESISVVEAYRRLKTARPTEVSLNLLWGMQAALLNIHWNMLTPDMKAALKAQIDE
jgi:DNA transformation protein and related proteins